MFTESVNQMITPLPGFFLISNVTIILFNPPGRTGRMGIDGITPGTAYTVLVSGVSSDSSLAVELVYNLQRAGQAHSITPQLQQLAESDPRWSKSKSSGSGGGKYHAGGNGANSHRGIGSGASKIS